MSCTNWKLYLFWIVNVEQKIDFPAKCVLGSLTIWAMWTCPDNWAGPSELRVGRRHVRARVQLPHHGLCWRFCCWVYFQAATALFKGWNDLSLASCAHPDPMPLLLISIPPEGSHAPSLDQLQMLVQRATKSPCDSVLGDNWLGKILSVMDFYWSRWANKLELWWLGNISRSLYASNFFSTNSNHLKKKCYWSKW